MKRTRFARSLVSLAVAYGVVCALFLGSIAAGRAASLPAPLCSAANAGDRDSAPLPVSRDLACLVSGCCGCMAPGFAPVISASLPARAPSPVVWPESFQAFSLAAFPAFAPARAPPAAA